MNLNQLKEKGGFVPPLPIAKEVTWKRTTEDGTEEELVFTVHVKKQSFGAIESLFLGNDDRSKSAAFIAQCIRLGDDGNEQMSYEDAYQLDPGLAAVLVAAINDVNETGRTKPKN